MKARTNKRDEAEEENDDDDDEWEKQEKMKNDMTNNSDVHNCSLVTLVDCIINIHKSIYYIYTLYIIYMRVI